MGMRRTRIWRTGWLGVALALAACGGDDLGIGATPTITATPPATATPTRTSTPVPVAAVAGLVVVGADVGRSPGDGLLALAPEDAPPRGRGFDRVLAGADWVVDDGVRRGTTGPDGRFAVDGLTPGRHALRFTKTVDGNLMTFAVPIVVGDDGAAAVLAEVQWGQVRATSTYREGGAAMRAVFGPSGTHLITRAGAPVELHDGWRTLVDADGDGRFDPQGCGGTLYACDAEGRCNSAEEICLCVPSCPDCADCPQRACVPRAYFHDPACGPDGLCKALPYRCGEAESCLDPDHQCSCVASCPGCDDCGSQACIEPCLATAPIDLLRVDVHGVDRLVVGQAGSVRAAAILSDGTSVDVTWLADWSTSDAAVLDVDAWGALHALAPGAAEVRAALAGVSSAPQRITVAARPALRRVHVQTRCYLPPVDPRGTDMTRPLPPADQAILPPPWCSDVLRVGAALPLQAIGEFDGDYYEDVTDQVVWTIEPAALGAIAGAVFTAAAPGAGAITATLDGVASPPLALTVVERASIRQLTVYPRDWAYVYLDGPVRADGSLCFDCGYVLTLLRGDAVTLAATAHYDTGEWAEVSERVAWQSSDGGVLLVDGAGAGTATGAGEAEVRATLEGVTSAPLAVRVVAEATLQSLSIYHDGAERVLAAGGRLPFHAVGNYDVGFARDVTAQVAWRSSDETVGDFDAQGVFQARAAGEITVWAELDGVASPALPLEVFAESTLDYCDPAQINRGEWADDFNRVTLESDCASYTPPAVAALRFTVTEVQRPGGVFDPCLDLYAYRGDTLVRTIRQEGCGEPFLPADAPGRLEAVLKYQLAAYWDLKDDAGALVPPGTYEIRGVFYLYYDPVVSVTVTVREPGGG